MLPLDCSNEGIIKAVHHHDSLLLVGVASRTNLERVLTGRTVLRTSSGQRTADTVGLWVDDPRVVAAQLEALASSDRRTA